MSKDLDKWVGEYVETPDSFRNAVKRQVEEELKKTQKEKSNVKICRKRWNPYKVAAVSLVFICLMASGAYAVSRVAAQDLVGRPIDERTGGNYISSDMEAFNQSVTPGWPQAMIDLFGEERAREVTGIEEPALNITTVFYDGLSLVFQAESTAYGKKNKLSADRLVIGNSIFMIQFSTTGSTSIFEGLKADNYIGRVELAGAELPNSFRAELVLGVEGKGTQNVAFDVRLDESTVVKPAATAAIGNGMTATVDALKIAASGTYIHVIWEFDESKKILYDQLRNETVSDRFVYMSIDDSNGNHFTTEKDGDFRQSIVFYADGREDWSGSDQNNFYEKNGKYYLAMGCIIEGMTEDVTSLTVRPYERTGMEEGAEHEYTYYDFAEFTVKYK